jgi:hypothetical protein
MEVLMNNLLFDMPLPPNGSPGFPMPPPDDGGGGENILY